MIGKEEKEMTQEKIKQEEKEGLIEEQVNEVKI